MKNQGTRLMLFGRLILTITILNFSNQLIAMEPQNSDFSLGTPKNFDLLDMLTTSNDSSGYELTSQTNSPNISRPSSPTRLGESVSIVLERTDLERAEKNTEPTSNFWTMGESHYPTQYLETREVSLEPDLEIRFSPETSHERNDEVTQNQSDSKQEVSSNDNDHSYTYDNNKNNNNIDYELNSLTAELKDEINIHEPVNQISNLQQNSNPINSANFDASAFFNQAEISRHEFQQSLLGEKTCSCCKKIEIPEEYREKINQVLKPISDLLVKQNTQHNHINDSPYKDYLNFVEKLLTLPSQANPKLEYEFVYLKNGISEIYFDKNGALKCVYPEGRPGEQLSNQIAIYMQNSLSHNENRVAVRYLHGIQSSNFKKIANNEDLNRKLQDSHPNLGLFATKSAVKNSAIEFGKKIEDNKANKELLGFVKLVKDEAFNGNKESKLKAQDFLAKNPNNRLAHIIYNRRYLDKPTFCKYDPKISQITYAQAVQRHKEVQNLISKLNLDQEKINPFLIKSFYEITDKNAPKISLDIILNLKIKGNENLIDKIAQEESIHKNEPAIKNALEYLRLAVLTRQNPENFNVRFLSFGINEALKNPNSDQTILSCNNFLNYPNQLNAAQIANKNTIINLASDACKKIYSESNTNNSAPVKQLKLANFLHNLNQDAAVAKDLSDTMKILSDSLLNGNSINNPELAALHNNIVNNALQIAEVSFNNPVDKSVDLNLLIKPAFGFNNLALSAVNKADKFSENSKENPNSSVIVENQIKALTNVARNSLVIARNLLNVAETICERSIIVMGEFAENPAKVMSDTINGTAQGALKGVGDTLASFDVRNLSVFYRLYSAAVNIKDVVSNLSLDEHEWLEKNKAVLKYLDELAEKIENSSTQDFFKQASSICVKIAIAPQIYKLAKKSINFTSDRIIGKTPEGFEFSTSASQKGGGKAEKIAKNSKKENTNKPKGNEQKTNQSPASVNENQVEWAHYPKHIPPKGFSWKDIIELTKHGNSKYHPEINIKELELHAWKYGQKVTNGKTWKVFKTDKTIGAKWGKETNCMRVECSANTIHGHPIPESEYLELLK